MPARTRRGYATAMARRLVLQALLLLTAAPALAAEEVPALAARVHAGDLPAVGERLPTKPRRDVPGRQDWAPGRYGGTLKTLTRGGRDARDLVVGPRTGLVEPFDGVAELWVESEDSLRRDWSTEKAKEILQAFFNDEQNFIDWTRSTILVAEELVVMP